MEKAKLPVEEIAKAVSGAVSSVLTQLLEKEGQSTLQSDDDFEIPQPSPVKKKRLGEKERKKTTKLPSTFVSSKGSTSKKAKYKERIYTYDRDIVCLPANYSQGKSSISIPRNREKLAKKGLIGKIRISSEMSQEEIFQEIRSVFRVPMNGNSSFQFQVLQQTGGRSKSLMVPAVSDSFKWTASAIAPKNAKVPLYVIAKEPLFADETADDSDGDHGTATDMEDRSNLIDLTKDTSSLIKQETPESAADDRKPTNSISSTVHALAISDNYSAYDDLEYYSDHEWQPDSPTPPPLSPITPDHAGSDSELSFADLLQLHRRDVLPRDTDEKVRVTVRRKYLFEDFLHKLRNGLDTKKHLRVTFVGEPAVDAGGPLREMMYRVISALGRCDMLFCGPYNCRVPRHNIVELDKKTYYYAGVMIALSLVHGGPAPQFFSPAVADYIVRGMLNVKATVDDIPDDVMKQKVEKIEEAKSDSELKSLIGSDEYDFRFDIGITKQVDKISFEDKHQIVSHMALHFGILVVKAELDQILCGLADTLNTLALLREAPKQARPLFIYKEKRPLNADELYDFIPAVFSEKGSNCREKEEELMMVWSDFLHAVQVADGEPTFKDTKFKFTLDDIMTFTTGMPREPPLGFIPEPSLAFLHDPTEVFPEANTCANILYLPTKHTKSLDNFGWAVCYGVLNAGGFGKI